jgi:hypothetical protein
MGISGVIMRFTGTLLLAAAVLKAAGLGVEPVGRMGLFSTPEFQLALIECELFLGIWFWSGFSPIGAWFAAVAAFSAFAGTTFYLGVVGQSSCGCFGRFSPSPWYAFGLDIFVLTLLALGRPDLKSLWNNPRRNLAAAAFPALYAIGSLVAVSSVLFGLAHIGFGSLPAAIAHFRGERVSVQPRLVDVAEGEQGETRTATVDVTNWTENAIRLFGGTSDCSCTVLGDLPLTIPPKETRTVHVDISLSGKPGIFTRKAAFLVDDEGYGTIRFRLTGRILKRNEESTGGN